MSLSEPPPQHIDVGGYNLALYRAGEAAPPAVLDAGLGDDASTWAAVLPHIAAFTSVVAYDRAGLGNSDAGLFPRTCAQMVQELRELLQRAHIVPPYILIGHSFGGLNVQLFAACYPDDVAGIVLIDTAQADIMERTEAIGHEWAEMLWQLELGDMPEGIDLETYRESCRQVAQAGPLPHVPTVLLTATQPATVDAEYRELAQTVLGAMQAGQVALLARIPGARQVFAEGSSHYIHQREPELVARIVRDVVEDVRQTSAV